MNFMIDSNLLPKFTEQPAPIERLSWYEVVAIAAFFLLAAVFGVRVEVHSAFLKIRHTDLVDFLRAGWAVRNGDDLYNITEDHGWHYNFPPLLAIVLVPLADPPKAPTGPE